MHPLARIATYVVTLALTLASTFCAAPWADAQQQASAVVTGTLIDVISNLPISNATIDLVQGTKTVASEHSDANGSFRFNAVNPGVYNLAVRALGYQNATSADVAVPPGGGTSNVAFSLQRQTSGDLQTIGRVSTRVQPLQSSATITRTVNNDLLQRENYVRIGDALQGLPGVNLRGVSSSVGDDLYVDVRGLKPSETQTLLDGHPIGPIGVFAGTGGGFNFQDSPLAAIANTQLTFGSGATGLYGVTSVGGTLDLQTIEPTQNREFQYRQSYGDQGRLSSAFSATGTEGKLGYAFVYGTTGTYGNFVPQTVAQNGTRAGDLTSPTAAGIAYTVSGNYQLRTSLAKFRYDLSPVTRFTYTGYTGTSWDDKTGEGDNDYLTLEQAYYNASNNPPSGSKLKPGCTDATPFQIQTDAGNYCTTAGSFAQSSYGPAGGGPGAWQSIINQDHHARLTSQLGKNNLVADAFIDNYQLVYHRDPSFIQGDLQINTSRYRTSGQLISDDIATEHNDFGFGYYHQTQRVFGDDTSDNTNQSLTQRPVQTQTYNNFFIRDVLTASPKLSFFLNAWLENVSSQFSNPSSTRSSSTIDPRLSVVFRPTSNDVVRLTGGLADGQPAPSSATFAAAGSINPGNCKTFTIGSVTNSGLLPEKARDLEIAYGHRFAGDTSISVDLYDTNEINQIQSARVSGSAFPTLVTPQAVAAYYTHINQICPGKFNASPSAADLNALLTTNLFVNQPFNASKARARGIEIAGRLRMNRRLFTEATYDVQSTQVFDIPNNLLVANPTLVDGGQLAGIPRNKASASIDWAPPSSDFRIDAYYVGNNNAYNRPPFSFANASFSHDVNRHITLNLGVQNLFNNSADVYGRIGYGVFVPENPLGGDNNAFDQGSERFSIAPRSVQLNVITRF